MILQEKHYIKKQKKKYTLHACLWTAVVLILFGTGLLLTGTRSNLFTISACVMAIVAALFITRLISFSRFKDGDEKMGQVLEAMKGSYHLYHSGILLDTKGTVYFEHIVVTAQNIYLITYEEKTSKKGCSWVIERLSSQGVPSKNIHFVVIKNETQMKGLAHRIEKDACYTSEKLDNYSKIMNETLM